MCTSEVASGCHLGVIMLATFTTLAYGFCAAIISAGPADLVAVGSLLVMRGPHAS
jgi:hypothetical protein